MRLLEGVATVDDLDAFVADLGAVADEHGVTVQAFDARYVVDRTHLERAVELADRASERGENVARDRAMEILLYAAGRRQIDRALEMGATDGECPVVLLVDGEGGAETGAEAAEDRVAECGTAECGAAEDRAAAALRESLALAPAETLGEYDPERVREFFDVGDAELAATDAGLPALVRERVALLDVEK